MSGSSAIQVFASPLPFSNRQVKHTVSEGTTIFDVVNEIVPNGYDGKVGVVVSISGHIVPYEYWGKVRPKQGAIVNIRVIPAGGGGGKNPIVTILSIAVAFAAPYVAGAALAGTAYAGASAFAFGSVTYTQLLSTAISVVGRLAVAALAPPPKQTGSQRVNNPAESPTQFIEGASNQLSPYGVVPLCLGTNRMFPMQAARPYTETENNDNYVRQLFTWGYGEVVYTDLRIGETPISEFSNVELADRIQGDLKEPTDLYSNSVFQEQLNVLLQQSDGFTVRQTQPDADEAVVDITFQGLTRFNEESGEKISRAVEFEIQYATLDEPADWSPGIDYKEISEKVFNAPTPVEESAGRGLPYDYAGEIECAIFINRFTGFVSLVEGRKPKTNYGAPTGEFVTAPIVPPANSYRLCSFTIRSQDGVVTLIDFSDDRNPSLFGSVFEDSNSFVPTVTGTQQVTISSGNISLPIRIVGKQTEPLRRSFRIKFPERNQYQVRIRRVSADTNNQYIIDKASLTALKTITYEPPVDEDDVSGTAVRMKATDQLNGSISQLNAIVSCICPDYDVDTDTWVERITSNPASLYRYVLQGSMNARPLADEKLDIAQLEYWHGVCLENGYTYNRVIDFETSLAEVLRDIASAGSASPAVVDGKRTVVIDEPKDDIVQIITPRNSWGYEGEMVYTEIPDAFRVTFRNAEKNFVQDEIIVYNDGYDESNAELYEGIDLQHVTNSTLAYQTARRYLAVIKLRPEIHTFNMDIENLVALRGDRIKFVNDVVLIGIGSARIKNVVVDSAGFVTQIQVDEDISVPSDGTYYVRVRLSNGDLLYKELITSVGTTDTFDFLTPFNDSLPAKGDLCYFTETGQEKDLIILSIQPGKDLTAQIASLDYAPEIFEDGPIPAFDSKITTPLEFIRPDPPILVETVGDETVMQRNSDGSFLTRLVISLENTNSGAVTTSVKIRESGTDQFRSATLIESSPEQVIITGLQDASRYDIHIRYRRAESNAISIPLQLNNFKFIGASGPPNDVSGFKITVVDGSALLAWDKNTDIDISHYKIKFSGVFSGALWGTAQTIENRVFENRLTVPFQSGTYLIKAVDLTGNESENATTIITYDQGNIRNVVEFLEQDPDFSGVKDNVDKVGDAIQLSSTGSDGYYYFNETIDLGDVFISSVSATVVAGGTFVNNLFDESDIFAMDDIFGVGGNNIFDMNDIYQVEDMFGIGDTGWAVQLQYRTTNDDPNDVDSAGLSTATWSAWQELETNDYEFRGIEFRLLLQSDQFDISPRVTKLNVLVDMPDRQERGEDLTVPVSGAQITWSSAFNKIPATVITIQDGDANDEIEFVSKTVDGFEFKVYNTTSATYVERTFDYISSGYGRN